MSAPAVAVSIDGTKFAAAWMDKRAGKDDANVYWSISPTPAFSQDSLLTERTKGLQDHPTLAVETSGTVWAVWEDSGSGVKRICARSCAPERRSHEVSEASDGPASLPVVAANNGLVAVVYEGQRHGEQQVFFRLLKPE